VKHPKEIDIAVLDKMMPDVSGLELMGCIKRNPTLKYIPVILQTGDVGTAQMREGLEGGAYYYLTKPFHPEVFTAILKAAENECILREELLAQEGLGRSKFLNMLQEGEFHLRTIAEARLLAATLAQLSPVPDLTARGLCELLFNAIEHGNLEIGSKTKSECLVNNTWRQELAKRLSDHKLQNRRVKVQTHKDLNVFHIVITDQGKGFNWHDYLQASTPANLNQPSGRGIAIAHLVLNKMHYNAEGNEVSFTIGEASNVVVPLKESLRLNTI
jgi:CheY-like chemotaxis protein